MHSERVVGEGVVLVRAWHFAACHLFDLPLRLIGNAVIVLLIPKQCLSEYSIPCRIFFLLSPPQKCFDYEKVNLEFSWMALRRSSGCRPS